jgi:transposase
MSSLPLFPAPKELELISLAPDARGITIHVRAKRRSVPCPDYGEFSNRVHSRYSCTLVDLPWHGTAVRLRVQTRRFFCPVPECEQRIFAERLSQTAARYARRTFRLAESLRAIAFALGGEAGARLTR